MASVCVFVLPWKLKTELHKAPPKSPGICVAALSQPESSLQLKTCLWVREVKDVTDDDPLAPMPTPTDGQFQAQEGQPPRPGRKNKKKETEKTKKKINLFTK